MQEKIARIRLFYIIISVILLLLAFPEVPRSLINSATGAAAADVELIVPLVNRIFSPFLDFPFYFSNFIRPRMQILSWIIWLSAIWIIFALTGLKGPRTKKTGKILRGMVVTAVSFSLFIIYCILVPLPKYRLTSDKPGEVFVDLHSHTFFSHDGIVTSERSLSWHLNCGFEGWALTEHDWIGHGPVEQEELLRAESIGAAVIPAQETRFKGVYLNLLGIEEAVDKKKFETMEGLISAVHSRGGAVVVPHYWSGEKPQLSPTELAEAGVDGFEIAGNSSVPLSQESREELIGICRREGLVMVSGSNWHGWQNFCNVWTGFEAQGWGQMDNASRKKEVIDALKKREAGRFRALEYRREVRPGGYFFEPFTGFFFYYRSLDAWQRLSWLFWAAAIFILARRIRNRRKTAIFIWSAVSLTLAAKGILILNTWQAVKTVNDILPEVSRGLFIMAALTAFLAVTNIRKKHRDKIS
ncbi:MAG: hypothetical protein JW957_07030 [Candidatus Omnitrophica bacterium]|nr:hypothetical protein [Candidatus Omnitrophota bacterium]